MCQNQFKFLFWRPNKYLRLQGILRYSLVKVLTEIRDKLSKNNQRKKTNTQGEFGG